MFTRLIDILIAFNLIALITGLSCNLNLRNPVWRNDWHLLVTKSANTNYQLLRTDKLDVNSDLLMFCNRKPNFIRARCAGNGRFNKDLLSYEQCDELDSLKPIKIKMKVPYCPYDLYRIGFNIEVAGATHFLEAYKVCFDQMHLRTLFVINKVYPFADHRPGFLQFDPDDIFYGKYFAAFSRGVTFKTFQKLLGNKQPYMDRDNIDHIIDRGHLAPSADFITTNLKRATFKMINVMPQFKTIDNENWRLIEQWTRQPAHAGTNICTGVLDCNLDSKTVSDLHCVVQLKSTSGSMVPIFLAENRKIPIPLWTYKIIKEKSVVFLTLNNIYHRGPVQVSDDMCHKIKCPLQLEASVTKGMTFCCSYMEFISKHVPHLKGVC